MSDLKKILVGVDLLESRQGNLSPPVNEAIKQAVGLAERLSSEVMFLAAVELPTGGEIHPAALNPARLASDIEVSARDTLRKLVERTAERGVRATSKFVEGQGWVELTREAIGGAYDLVVVGTRDVGPMRRALFGSTAMKLLHHCPRPVWVAKPEPLPTPANVLVASDFSEVSDEALRLALRIASAAEAKVHLMHAIEQPYVQFLDAGLLETSREELIHQKHLAAAAEKRLEEQLARLHASAGANVEIYVAEGLRWAHGTILQQIEARQIDLLVMGVTTPRGPAGVFLGTTAERLLTSLGCSLLAVKPSDFVCSVPLESYHYAPAMPLVEAPREL